MATKYVITPGQRFGRWTTIEAVANSKPRKWICVCDCGTRKAVIVNNLVHSLSVSCGCFMRECLAKSVTTHGLSDLPEYEVWKGMIARCHNQNHKSYKFYGGIGVEVCDRWRNSFEAFMEDMGPRPTSKHSIDRVSGGNYEPGNCRWITQKEQTRNTRRNVNLTYAGKTQCVAAWAEETGISNNLLHHRLYLGWTPEEALTTPVRKQRKCNTSPP